MTLPAADWALLADGCGQLYVLRTGDRGGDTAERWQVSDPPGG